MRNESKQRDFFETLYKCFSTKCHPYARLRNKNFSDISLKVVSDRLQADCSNSDVIYAAMTSSTDLLAIIDSSLQNCFDYPKS